MASGKRNKHLKTRHRSIGTMTKIYSTIQKADWKASVFFLSIKENMPHLLLSAP